MTTFEAFPRDGYAFSAAEVGTALGGLLRRDANGLPVAGVIGRPEIRAVASSWRVKVDPFLYAHRSGAVISFSGVSAAEEVDIATSANIPSGQGRIDLICWDRDDAELAVIEGAPSASPEAPPAGGLIPLARVRVNAGDGMVIANRVTSIYESTWLQGAESRVAVGTVSKRHVAPGGVTNVNATFPAGLFTGVPNVQATAWGDARDVNVQVDNITKDGFVLRLCSTSTRARTLGAQWRASQISGQL